MRSPLLSPVPAALLAAVLVASTPARADIVTDWYDAGYALTNANPPGGVFSTRALALAHLAIHDAVNAVERRYESYGAGDAQAASGASLEAAAAGAAHAVYSLLYPNQKTLLDTTLAAQLAKLPGGASAAANAQGVALGRSIGERLVAERRDDGSATPVAFTPTGKPGAWKPTPPDYAPNAVARWPRVKPLIIRSVGDFLPPPPPPVTSATYAKAIEEVRKLGGRNSTERTADQTATAIFWVAPTYHPYAEVAKAESKARQLSVHDNARLFALLNVASFDTYLAGYHAKIVYDQLRPVSAIREAASLGNPGIVPDASWEPLLQTPASQDYVSGHAVQAGGYERVAQAVFGGDELKASASAVWPAGAVRRSYTRWTQLTQEDNDARIWGGIHTRIATDAGDEIGRQVGDYLVKHALRPVSR
ncbi:vanadium-dependent haloperoxidase [Roseateles sp. MS654]|uniref:vanadium-dependent haloperoxidase n=1 Tax=Roseateles sp. MS654 TaxID=3412685 RepID=UPI003C2BA463